MKKRLEPALTKINEYLVHSPGVSIWICTLAAVMLMGVYSLLASLLTSLEIMEFSIQIPWAGMVSTYVFLVADGPRSGRCETLASHRSVNSPLGCPPRESVGWDGMGWDAKQAGDVEK